MAAMVICASWYVFRRSLSVLAVARQAVAMPATLAVMERGSITKAHQQTENTGQCRANWLWQDFPWGNKEGKQNRRGVKQARNGAERPAVAPIHPSVIFHQSGGIRIMTTQHFVSDLVRWFVKFYSWQLIYRHLVQSCQLTLLISHDVNGWLLRIFGLANWQLSSLRATGSTQGLTWGRRL